jgi:outer membrane biosynthesis protein TonB
MRTFFDGLRLKQTTSIAMAACGLVVLAAGCVTAVGQAPSPVPAPPSSPAATAQEPAQQSPPQGEPLAAPAPQQVAPANAASPESHPKPEKDPTLHQGGFTIHTVGGEIKEDELKKMLVGKTLYLRGGYQDNNLEFDEHGRILSHSTQGSYTLSQIQINKVKLSKKRVELVGDRYALHFLGASTSDDPTAATDRVKINPKKKAVHISFDREEVEKSKDKDKDKDPKKKDKHHGKGGDTKKGITAPPAVLPIATETTVVQSSASDHAPKNDHKSDKKRTTTNSATSASQTLLTALNNALSVGVDERMIDAMPDFWKLYYQSARAKTDYRPTDPGVFRASAVDQKAKLISAVDPPSNELAQANGVAGIALYHVVVGSDGKVEEVVAGRPIGFGLDEGADQTIRKATFQPAMKDGRAVPVALDLVVSFRIYSKRTSQPVPAVKADVEKPKETILPGPYTVRVQAAQTQAQSQTAQPTAVPQ